MSIFESFLVALFCLTVVFSVLIALFALIRIFSFLINIFSNQKHSPPVIKNKNEKQDQIPSNKQNLNNKTNNTMIMATVSDETGNTISEFCFKSIKLVK